MTNETKDVGPKSKEDIILDTLGNLAKAAQQTNDRLGEISKRVETIEEDNKKPIEEAKAAFPVDPETPPDILESVQNILGKDFGIEVKALRDMPGYDLTIIVPEKYGLIKSTITERELKRKSELENKMEGMSDETKEYKVLWEELFSINGKIVQQDRRTKFISRAEGIDGVKNWALLVKKNVFKSHQNSNSVMPT